MKKGLLILGISLLTLTNLPAQSDYWSNYTADSFSGGNGEKDSPYEISTAEELALLAKQINNEDPVNNFQDKYFILMNDIDLSEHYWVPIGYYGSSTYFSGNFNGNNKNINGLYIGTEDTNPATYNYAGLFATVLSKSSITIKDLTVRGEIIRDAHDMATGGVIGQVLSSNNGTVNIENCTNYIKITYGASLSSSIGGVIGDVSNGSSHIKVTNCSNYGKITGELVFNSSIGGIIGRINNYFTHTTCVEVEVEDCRNYTEIIGPNNSFTCRTGGIIGSSSSWLNTDDFENSIVYTKISNCVNYAKITGGKAQYISHTGGITGNCEASRSGDKYCHSSLTISSCINYGEIIGGEDKIYAEVPGQVRDLRFYTGGIAGDVSVNNDDNNGLSLLNIRDCYSRGTITASTGYTGGLIGVIKCENEGITNISSSYADIDIQGTSDYAGGLIGKMVASSSSIPVIDSCLVIIHNIEGININRITAKLEGADDVDKFFGILGNYAWANNTYTWNKIGLKDQDGADWDGSINSQPISVWDRNIWDIDLTEKYMPKLKGIETTLQPNIENPLWKGSGVNIEDKNSSLIQVKSISGHILINNLEQESLVRIYTLSGTLIIDKTVGLQECSIPMPQGIYIVSINGKTTKIVVP